MTDGLFDAADLRRLGKSLREAKDQSEGPYIMIMSEEGLADWNRLMRGLKAQRYAKKKRRLRNQPRKIKTK